MKGIVYLATNMINGKCYVGRTINTLKYRRRKHEQPFDIFHFHAAILKYGKENFLWETLEEIECDDKIKLNVILNKYEVYYIRVFNSRSSGYNLTDGGDGTVGAEGLHRFGEDAPFFGKHHTSETNEKNRLAHTGKPMHPNTRASILKSRIGSTPWNKGLTKETDERVRKNY